MNYSPLFFVALCACEPGPLSGYVELCVSPELVGATEVALDAWAPLPLTVEIVDYSSPYSVTFGDLSGVDELGHTESTPWTVYRTVYVHESVRSCSWAHVIAHEVGHLLTGAEDHSSSPGVMLASASDDCHPPVVTQSDRDWLGARL